ncbi:MAG: 2-amino-4-hydroxy-6-hydroxymethyldihydropteridine diphosphokinase [Dehalogenimonas sp.]|jgi:2-amino-4-hydroxy-6-hydroxymethyldihydropteridine diphosphokinase|uniref:2-amino-4-hydroxy-6-hydroxymethyldihydropteridine diphosphokinase n=1 Tax=Candidatus Dehalogenimonas loeffleri TaxID=3127115 RepID=A0ABZ2J9H1_9CHLR|nr:2-amino-4-hydroxy-6-hydroxymethyldihydropteridine diphosphokinase [Dehalogenimonas sp.]
MDNNELKLTSAATAYLGLGSNLGDRLANLERAVGLLSRPLKILRISPVYETEPVDVPEQGKFLNLVVEAQTHIAPADLLKLIKGMEQVVGRGKAGSGQPRIIDIDILLYGNIRVNSENLVIPHPRLSRRAFVLRPLNDLVPKLRHPGNRKTMAELLLALGDIKGVYIYPASVSP